MRLGLFGGGRLPSGRPGGVVSCWFGLLGGGWDRG